MAAVARGSRRCPIDASGKLVGDEGELDRPVRARYVVLPTAGEPYLWFASDTLLTTGEPLR